jgi:DNA helicase-2/ATP-dependent DNA helicase PcrA
VGEQRDIDALRRLAGRLTNERDATRVTEFAGDIAQLQALSADGAAAGLLVEALVGDIGLGGAVATLDDKRRGMNRAAQGDDLLALRQLACLHDDADTFERWLRERLATKRDPSGVVLATVHRVKGQEWPHVVVHHVDAEQYPHRLADDVEEERRLFHVAITRASTHATVVTGPDPSPFVEELSTDPSPQRVVSSHRPEPVVTRTSKPKKGDPTADLDADAAARFDRLKVLRTELAAGKPAYVVFDNKTLAAIARTAPTSKRELARISGVGPAKLEKYGDAFVELITTMA